MNIRFHWRYCAMSSAVRSTLLWRPLVIICIFQHMCHLACINIRTGADSIIVLRNTIIIMLIIFMQPVGARMYQWVDPVSGTTQLSGTPPTWYRSGQDAPRVFVFEQGQLVDDTGMTVGEGQRRQLRREALIRAEESIDAARRKAEQSAQRRSRLDDNDTGIPPVPELPEAAPPPDELEQEATAETVDEAELIKKEMQELRRLVSEWESRNRAANQRRLESLNTDDSSSADSKPSVTREQVLQYLESRSQ